MSSLSRSVFIVAMIGTAITGAVGIKAADAGPQKIHPTKLRTFQLAVSSFSGVLNIITAMMECVMLNRCVIFMYHFPVQAVEVPHYGFFLAFSVICAIVNIGLAYRFTHKLYSRMLDDERNK